MSGHDQPNPVSTVTGCPSEQEDTILPTWITHCVPQENNTHQFAFHIINPLLTEFVPSRWQDIGLVLFCVFMDQSSRDP